MYLLCRLHARVVYFGSGGKSFNSDGKMASIGKAARLEVLDSEDRVVLVFKQGFRR